MDAITLLLVRDVYMLVVTDYCYVLDGGWILGLISYVLLVGRVGLASG